MVTESTKARRQQQDARHREAVRIFYETGNEDSLGPMLAKLRPSLIRFLRSKGIFDPLLLEEISQLALAGILNGIRKRMPRDTGGTFFNWAATVAWSAYLDYKRREFRHGQPSAPGSHEDPFLLLPTDAVVYPEEAADNAENEARASQLIKSATQAVMQLDPNARQAVVLHFYQGLELAAAAGRVGIHLNRFTKRLERGISALREWAAKQEAPTDELYAAVRRVDTGDLFKDSPEKLTWRAKRAARQRAEE